MGQIYQGKIEKKNKKMVNVKDKYSDRKEADTKDNFIDSHPPAEQCILVHSGPLALLQQGNPRRPPLQSQNPACSQLRESIK